MSPPSDWEKAVAPAAVGAGFVSAQCTIEAIERARVVGVLDAWAAEVNGRVWMVSQHEGPHPKWCCKLGGLRWYNQDTPDAEWCCKLGGLRWYNQDTPDAARAAAAAAIEKGGV